MNKLKSLFAVLLSIGLLSSCLGDGNHVVEYYSQVGVAAIEGSGDGQETYIYTTDTTRFLPTNSYGKTLSTGEAVLFSYKMDLDDFKGSNYQYGEITSTVDVLKEDLVTSTLRDTINIDPLERTIPTVEKRNTVIRDMLFLYLKHNIEDSIKIGYDYTVSYDPDQAPIAMTNVNYDVYQVYLEALADSSVAARSNEKTLLDIPVFNIKEFLTESKRKEGAKNKDSLYFHVKYAKSFNSDTTTINWGESDLIKLSIK